MPRETIETTILDDEGNPHDYSLFQHPAREGFELQARLTAILGGSIARAFAALAGGEREGDEDETVIDGAELAGAVEGGVRQILEHGGANLALTLLKHTTRDGRLLSASEFDKAYKGNYGEMYQAMWWAISQNFGGLLKRVPFDLSALSTLMPAG